MITGPAAHDLTHGMTARLPEDADIGRSAASGLTPRLDAFCLAWTTDSTRHFHEAWTALAKRLEDRSWIPPMRHSAHSSAVDSPGISPGNPEHPQARVNAYPLRLPRLDREVGEAMQNLIRESVASGATPELDAFYRGWTTDRQRAEPPEPIR